jgi:hypothetical protein
MNRGSPIGDGDKTPYPFAGHKRILIGDIAGQRGKVFSLGLIKRPALELGIMRRTPRPTGEPGVAKQDEFLR